MVLSYIPSLHSTHTNKNNITHSYTNNMTEYKHTVIFSFGLPSRGFITTPCRFKQTRQHLHYCDFPFLYSEMMKSGFPVCLKLYWLCVCVCVRGGGGKVRQRACMCVLVRLHTLIADLQGWLRWVTGRVLSVRLSVCLRGWDRAEWSIISHRLNVRNVRNAYG